jgi:hypothetical protein
MPVVEVVERQVGSLQLGAHRAVADPLRQGVQDVGARTMLSHPTRIVGLCK